MSHTLPPGEEAVPPGDSPVALFRVVARHPVDGGCIRATLAPARRAASAPVELTFCHPNDVDHLRSESPRRSMVTLLAEHGSDARLLPVTVGLSVSVVAVTPRGDLKVLALPRPMPLHLPAGSIDLRAEIEAAIERQQSIVFALSDSVTIIDAASIEREAALAMLGMAEGG